MKDQVKFRKDPIDLVTLICDIFILVSSPRPPRELNSLHAYSEHKFILLTLASVNLVNYSSPALSFSCSSRARSLSDLLSALSGSESSTGSTLATLYFSTLLMRSPCGNLLSSGTD